MKKIGIIAFDIIATVLGILLAGFGCLIVWFICMNAMNGFGWDFIMLALGLASFFLGSWMFARYSTSNKDRDNLQGD